MYCLYIFDNFSGFGTCLLLRAKSDTSSWFTDWVSWAKQQLSPHLLKKVHSYYGGGEFLADAFRSLLHIKGVEHQLSVADHPQQNGWAECFNRTALE